ncbi:unnamed protein product [Merluccius merluccius]
MRRCPRSRGPSGVPVSRTEGEQCGAVWTSHRPRYRDLDPQDPPDPPSQTLQDPPRAPAAALLIALYEPSGHYVLLCRTGLREAPPRLSSRTLEELTLAIVPFH